MNIFNFFLSLKIKNRIKTIENAIQNPIEYQDKILKSNLQFAKQTIFGKEHNFHKIKTYSDFKNNIHINNYESIQKYIELSKKNKKNILWPGKVIWFAKSSGTTQNKSKFIPVTKDSLHSCHFKAGKDMLAFYLNENPQSNILNGKSLMIGGSTSINHNNNYYSGDLSAIIIQNLPIWVQKKRVPSIETALLEDWEKKIKQIIKESIGQNIVSISGVPSWTIIIINELLKKTKQKYIPDIWPNLELYMHGGVHFENYKNTFSDFFNQKKINYLEIYNASEGFFGIQNNSEKSDLLLLINHGIFYEFTPIENGQELTEKTVSLRNVELNKIYAIIITTNGGLWRYKIGDTIRFTCLAPYKIKICGRTHSFINAFGEELKVSDANQAISYACLKSKSIVNEYIAAPHFLPNKSGCHEWIVEFKKAPTDLDVFINLIDEKLKSVNSDYESKRYKNILLKKPIIHQVKKKFFYNILKNKNQIGGQNKVKRLYNNRNFIEDLLKKL